MLTNNGLTISPAEVNIGESVTISITITNTGDLSGSYKAILKVDDAVIATKEVTLDGGASQKVTFSTSKDTAGTYTVGLGGLSGTFTVKAPPAPPVKPPAPPAPSVTPPAPPAPPIPPFNWWFIGGVIAGGIIVVIIIWTIFRRREIS
ncbi:CARDB domain-containing protein [Chloroflexota bacterium]